MVCVHNVECFDDIGFAKSIMLLVFCSIFNAIAMVLVTVGSILPR
jgi:hypothetical protein